MNYFRMIIILLLSLPCTCLAIEEIKDTSHYDVVTEYVRSLGAIHNLQQMANQEVQDDIEKNNSHIICIYLHSDNLCNSCALYLFQSRHP